MKRWILPLSVHGAQAVTKATKRSQICIFSDDNKFCTLCTCFCCGCIFHSRSSSFHDLFRSYYFSSSYLQIADTIQTQYGNYAFWRHNELEETRNDYRKAKFHFQMDFSRSHGWDCLSYLTLGSLSKPWSSQLWTQFKQLRREAWTPLKSWLFQASLRNCLNCVHNCDDHGLLDFNAAVQYKKHFIYIFTLGSLEANTTST